MTLHTATDVEFLESIGVVPYDSDAFRDAESDRIRTFVLKGVAALQFAGLIAALLWTVR